jgi:hypothetical protein
MTLIEGELIYDKRGNSTVYESLEKNFIENLY